MMSRYARESRVMRRIRNHRDEVHGVSWTSRGDESALSHSERDPGAKLESLFDEAYDGIVRYCTVRTGLQSVAEDIAAATFVDAAFFRMCGACASVLHWACQPEAAGKRRDLGAPACWNEQGA